jgi:hypothetical protein
MYCTVADTCGTNSCSVDLYCSFRRYCVTLAKKGLLIEKPHLCADGGPRAFANPWDLLRERVGGPINSILTRAWELHSRKERNRSFYEELLLLAMTFFEILLLCKLWQGISLPVPPSNIPKWHMPIFALWTCIVRYCVTLAKKGRLHTL